MAFKFASKLVVHLLENHQQVSGTEQPNDFVAQEFSVAEVVWLLLVVSPKLVFFCVTFMYLLWLYVFSEHSTVFWSESSTNVLLVYPFESNSKLNTRVNFSDGLISTSDSIQSSHSNVERRTPAAN